MVYLLIAACTMMVLSCRSLQQTPSTKNTSQTYAVSRQPEELRLIKNSPKVQQALALIDKKDLRRRLQALGIGEEDAITLEISPKGEILQLYATDIKIAGALSEAVAVSGGIMLAPGYYLLGSGELGYGAGSILVGVSMILLGAKLHKTNTP